MQTGNQSISFEIKSQLAKLLATENISMRHEPNNKTAYFNVEKRELVLPVWQNISEDLYDMLVVHEVGHALDTPMDKWLAGIETIANKVYTSPTDRNKSAVKGFLNVIEDARIDKRQKRRYPGSRRNFVNGYKELHEKDFFGIAKRDINAMTFIDRANIFFKGGAIFNIKFTDEERVFLKRMENAETFEDVLTITSDVFEYSLKKKDSDKNKPDAEEILSQIISEFDDNGDIEDFDGEEFDDLDVDYESDEDESGSSNQKFSNDDDEEEDATKSNSEEKNDNSANTPDIDIPETEKAAQEASKNIVMDDNYRYIYIKTPELEHSAIIDDYKVVMEDMKGCYNEYDKRYRNEHANDLRSWMTSEQQTISYMVKEFDMRKAADTYARTSISKTGVIDTNKVHSYKYNDDIFRRSTTISAGKNHGFVMFVDWSGSMIAQLNNTMKQLFSLVMFCKKIQVPFEVYIFRDTNNNFYGNNVQIRDVDNSDINFGEFRIRNILSSRMSAATMNEAFTYLWMMSIIRGFRCDELNGTPLNQTIMAADYIVNKFHRETKVQIVNTIFLTDGASDSIYINHENVRKSEVPFKQYRGSRHFIEDHITKKNYFIGDYAGGHKLTETLLKMLKERTGSNLVGFYVTSSLKSVFTILDLVDKQVQKTKLDCWRANNYAGFVANGYDEYYAVNMKTANVEDSVLNVTPNMKQNVVVREFMKFNGKKASNRVMLSNFIRRIAA